MRRLIALRALALAFAAALFLAGSAGAAEVRVMISGGLTAAYKELVPEALNRQQGADGIWPFDGDNGKCDPEPAGTR